jgi:hypothetical protein
MRRWKKILIAVFAVVAVGLVAVLAPIFPDDTTPDPDRPLSSGPTALV